MRPFVIALCLAVALPAAVRAQTRIDSINTNFRWLGSDDKIIVERYDDPRVGNAVHVKIVAARIS